MYSIANLFDRNIKKLMLEKEAENQKHRISGSENCLLLIKKSVAAIFQSENVIFKT